MKTVISLLGFSLLFISCSTRMISTQEETKESYSPRVSFEESGKNFSATIQLPKNFSEKLPLVIIAHEWWGRTPYIMERTKMLTEEGFAALPVDLYGDGKTAETPAEAKSLANPFYQAPELGLKRLQEYIELAKKDPHVDEDKIFVIGYCFGGTQALNLARSGADVEGVVSFHGGLTSSYPTKEVKARVLVLNGAADPMVSPRDVASFRKEMEKAGAHYRVINYPGATHAFTNPNATETGRKFNMPVAYDEAADKASWSELLIFLKK